MFGAIVNLQLVLIHKLAKLATITLYYFSANRSVLSSCVNPDAAWDWIPTGILLRYVEPQDVEA